MNACIKSPVKRNIILSLAQRYARFEHLRYTGSFQRVEQVQREKLHVLLKAAEKTEYGATYSLKRTMSWEDFSRAVPVIEYSDVEDMIARQMELGKPVISGSPCRHYEPSTGATGNIKWIPCTDLFLSEIDSAASQTLAHFMNTNRRIFAGKHFWSLPWFPAPVQDMIRIHGDPRYRPFLQKKIRTMFMAVPDRVSFIRDYNDYCIALCAHLAAEKNLVLFSIWNPSVALNLFDVMSANREEIASIIERGSWGTRENALPGITCPRSKRAAHLLQHWDGNLSGDFFTELWPRMAMISSWESGSSAIWARELMRLFPDSVFQGKGLWATEGVVTIPLADTYALAVTSHFYEFIDLDTKEIVPSWSLTKGQVVSPLISTGSGLFRYNMKDIVEVTGFINQCPCLEYRGRAEKADLAGEEVPFMLAQKTLDETGARFGITAVSIFAVPGDYATKQEPYYVMLCEKGQNEHSEEKIAAFAEKVLSGHLRYKLARDFHQLGPVEVIMRKNARKLYQRIAADNGLIVGTMKMEPLLCLNRSASALLEE